jgi:hypothetical protein
MTDLDPHSIQLCTCTICYGEPCYAGRSFERNVSDLSRLLA